MAVPSRPPLNLARHLSVVALLLGLWSAAAGAADRGAWAPSTSYAVSDIVSYGGKGYDCRQAHTSQTGWEPPNVAALWLERTGGTPSDTQAPSTPSGVSSSGKTSSSVSLAWTASTDNVGVTGYEIFVGSATTAATTSTSNSATVSGLTANTTYTFTVKARDAAGNRSAASSAFSTTTSAQVTDTQAPSTPASLRATGSTGSSISLEWNASTDNVGVTAYLVSRNGTQVGTSTSASYTDSGLSASTSYVYTVKARDAAGNVSSASSQLSASTGAASSSTWHPSTLAIGTVYEPFTGTDKFFSKVNPYFSTSRRIDYGYLYLNGGSQISEWHDRAVRLANKSREQGMTPIYVVYGIGGNTDSPAAVWGNLQSASFLSGYFQGLKDVGQTATSLMGTGRVGYIIEPDTLGYIQQQYASQYNNDPNQMPAATYAVYDSGVLQRGVDPTFANTLNGLVQCINYTLRKYTPKAFLGWQLNLWAAPGAPGTGIMHSTEVYGFDAGKTRIQDNAKANAEFARKAGVQSGGAEFISIDKYGLDGAGANGANPNDPASSLWFWNADLWNNYLLFVKTLNTQLGLPVILWQVPAGHINGTTRRSPTAYNSSGTYPTLANGVQTYEESASPYFFGDSMTLSGNRLAYFSKNVWADSKVSVSGSTVTWGSHIPEAAKAGVVAILMGAGVGVSTRGIPQPGASPEDLPTDGYYWISRTQEYLANPVTLP